MARRLPVLALGVLLAGLNALCAAVVVAQRAFPFYEIMVAHAAAACWVFAFDTTYRAFPFPGLGSGDASERRAENVALATALVFSILFSGGGYLIEATLAKAGPDPGLLTPRFLVACGAYLWWRYARHLLWRAGKGIL
jgi:hypothetical protein